MTYTGRQHEKTTDTIKAVPTLADYPETAYDRKKRDSSGSFAGALLTGFIAILSVLFVSVLSVFILFFGSLSVLFPPLVKKVVRLFSKDTRID